MTATAGLIQRAWGFTAPVTSVIRAPGWVALAVGLVAFVVGGRLGWAELVVVWIALASMLVAAVVFVLGRTSYQVALDLARLRVTVGEEAFGEIAITNPSRRALLPSDATLAVGEGLATFRIPRLAAGASHSESFRIPTQRRTVLSVGPVRSSRGDALGLLRREVTWTDVHELFVHPLTVNLDGSSAGFLRDLEGTPTDDLSSSDVSFHALREYVPGDDRRHIHWKTSARIGRFMVRQFEETRRSHLVVALSSNLADYGSEDELELAISAGASLGLQAIKEGKDLTVMTSGGVLRSQTGMRLLDDCSRLEPVRDRNLIADVAAAASVRVPDASVAVLLAGSTPSPHQIRAAAVHFPVDVAVVVVRCVPGIELARKTLGGTPLLELGGLTDLAKGMRAL
ncbi:MAG: DUF58 domain-containing protein [Bifidobacteriaceae bacterium]|nr:DUF58 domain-containing protein [Bifidobacteriaceae bacterium]